MLLPTDLDYRLYMMARLLGEHFNLGSLEAVAAHPTAVKITVRR
ncbi:MAG: hypothetical protein OHK0012_00550 [Synechococcales cyanobacterium]